MKYSIKHENWSEAAAKNLSPAIEHDPFYSIEDLKTSVEAGKQSLFNVYDKTKNMICSFVLRDEGNEVVIVAAGGKTQPRLSLMKTFLPFIKIICEQKGIESIRAHTAKPGMCRAMESLGFSLAEKVYRIGV